MKRFERHIARHFVYRCRPRPALAQRGGPMNRIQLFNRLLWNIVKIAVGAYIVYLMAWALINT